MLAIFSAPPHIKKNIIFTGNKQAQINFEPSPQDFFVKGQDKKMSSKQVTILGNVLRCHLEGFAFIGVQKRGNNFQYCETSMCLLH